MPLLSLLLLACQKPEGPAPWDTGPAGQDQDPALLAAASEVDECATTCLTVRGPAFASFQLESDLDGFVGEEGRLSAQGEAEACVSGLSPGEHRLALLLEPGRAAAALDLTVHPFGWAWGLDRTAGAPSALQWQPSFTEEQLAAGPLLEVQPGDWDELSVLAPSVIRLGGETLLYYAGTADEDFSLGIARSSDGQTFTRYSGNPILGPAATGAVEGDWDYYAQNTPHALLVDGRVWLYYTGRGDTAGSLSIGLATSDDGLRFTRESTPVLSPTGAEADFDGGGVAHPSVLLRSPDRTDNPMGATRVFEMWYASGTLAIGYALSTDGRSFQRYCKGAVFTGRPGSWDRRLVKSPEVIWAEGRYRMSYSGCGQGCYQVGWAESTDGTTWRAAEEPIIPTQPAPAWNSYGTQEAFIEQDGGLLRFWYAGTGDSHGQIGRLDLQP